MDELMLSDELKMFFQAIQGLVDIDEEDLEKQELMDAVMEHVNSILTPLAKKQSVDQIIQNLELQGSTKEEAATAMNALKEVINELVYADRQYTGNKKILLEKILGSTFEIFDKVLEKYHMYSIELPMVVDTENGAKVPTYAHDTDAAADLYAMETVIVQGNTAGNKIRTGVKIQLPEGWLALIIPRSSIGAKTPLRLSNSVGLIDSGYRGELGVLYDNISDSPYAINAGDRIAQLLVMPSYRFKPEVVETLEDSDRGEGGFGSSGN